MKTEKIKQGAMGWTTSHLHSCGAYGYDELLEIIKNPKHEEHKERMTWLGGDFDPELFDCGDVHFSNPEEIWKLYR